MSCGSCGSNTCNGCCGGRGPAGPVGPQGSPGFNQYLYAENEEVQDIVAGTIDNLLLDLGPGGVVLDLDGEYRIALSGQWQPNPDPGALLFRLEVDGLVIVPAFAPPPSLIGWSPFAQTWVYPLLAGAHTVELLTDEASGVADAQVRQLFLELWRVA